MPISRYIVVAVARCSRACLLARSPVELAEAEVAVGDERAHAAWLRERQGPAIVSLAALGVEPVGWVAMSPSRWNASAANPG